MSSPGNSRYVGTEPDSRARVNPVVHMLLQGT